MFHPIQHKSIRQQFDFVFVMMIPSNHFNPYTRKPFIRRPTATSGRGHCPSEQV